MVDSVKSAISRMETVKMRRTDAAGSQASATAPKPSGKTDSDSVELKSAEMVLLRVIWPLLHQLIWTRSTGLSQQLKRAIIQSTSIRFPTR